jgi:hypothetical protein
MDQVVETKKEMQQRRFLELAKRIGPLPTGKLATPNDHPFEQWIEKTATELVNFILEQVHIDHEQEHPHEDHQEDFESAIENKLRDAAIESAKYIAPPPLPAKSTKPLPVEQPTEFELQIVLTGLKNKFSLAMETLEDLLTAITTHAPRWHMDAMIKAASELVWAEKKPSDESR